MESPAAPIIYEDPQCFCKYCNRPERVYLAIKSGIIGLLIGLFIPFIVRHTNLNIITNNFLGYKFMIE